MKARRVGLDGLRAGPLLQAGMRGFCYAGAVSVVTGAAIVPTTIFWGLLVTGVAVSWPIVLTAGLAGASANVIARAAIDSRLYKRDVRVLDGVLSR